jgi:DNA-binding NarL/FixJ family response regulator
MAFLIVDDEERDRHWLKNLLSENFSEQGSIHEAVDGQAAVELAKSLEPAVVFLDIKMPKLSGIKAAELILKQTPEVAVIMLSNFADEVYVRQLWKIVPANGVFGYVLKNASNEQVIEATRSVLSGDCWIHPGIARVIQRTQNRATNLTGAEYEALICISLGMTDHAIAKHLYLTEKAIQSRLKSLYAKLRIPARGESADVEYNQRCRAVYTALRRGLINQSELDEWETKIMGARNETVSS